MVSVIDTCSVQHLLTIIGLYNAFLAPGSPNELNIDHSLRTQLATRMTRAVGDDAAMLQSLNEVASLFEKAQNSIFKLMSSVCLALAHLTLFSTHSKLGLCTQIHQASKICPTTPRPRCRRRFCLCCIPGATIVTIYHRRRLLSIPLTRSCPPDDNDLLASLH